MPCPSDDPTIAASPEVPGRSALPGAGLWRGAGARCAIVIGSVMDGRDVAQFGSALDWGSRGRRFKSGRPDAAHRPLITAKAKVSGHLCAATSHLGVPLPDAAWDHFSLSACFTVRFSTALPAQK